jgi:hypothetical protein
MKALWFLVVFLVVTATVTVAAVTALFIFWSLVPVPPGTAASLALLFLVAPGLGILSGLLVAVRAVRKADGDAASHPAAASGWLLTGLGALVGGLAGFGGTMATIDLTYTERWSDPASAPSWLPVAPGVAGVTMAILVALLVRFSVSGRRTLRQQR